MTLRAICHFHPTLNHGITGTITFEEASPRSRRGVFVNVNLSGFSPNGTYAIHVHEYGDLTDGCKSLGPHFNPDQHSHGSRFYTTTRHAGDLINNLHTDHEGNVCIQFFDDMIRLSCQDMKRSIIGRSIVIHRYSDDYGLQGVQQGNKFIPYRSMSYHDLRTMAVERKYIDANSRISHKALMDKFNHESITTGNAGQRVACAIIGIAADTTSS